MKPELTQLRQYFDDVSGLTPQRLLAFDRHTHSGSGGYDSQSAATGGSTLRETSRLRSGIAANGGVTGLQLCSERLGGFRDHDTSRRLPIVAFRSAKRSDSFYHAPERHQQPLPAPGTNAAERSLHTALFAQCEVPVELCHAGVHCKRSTLFLSHSRDWCGTFPQNSARQERRPRRASKVEESSESPVSHGS